MYRQNAMQQYRHAQASAAIDSSPYKVISMLMQGALDRMVSAKGCIANNDIAGRNHFIGKAADIIDCLKNSLEHKHDEEMTNNLDNLYDYMARRLFHANLKNCPDTIDEVYGLLDTIYDGWKELEDKLPDAGVSVASVERQPLPLSK
ncbi:MAG: flagellar export chaperone FliS [Candidatus Pelagadaptatus aseana]|uniref:flagellar export chaperone FliS n=1 Tax=Candidatus Pelagadaptatus aseana TaxID=3120508 RepID=UPI0039B1EA12